MNDDTVESSGWSDWIAYWDREAPEARVSYAPLSIDALPQIQMVARANLRNVLVGAHDIRCTCPMHNGDPAATTMRINLDPSSTFGIGFFKCYSCGAAGHWNKLALHLGVDPLIVDPNPEWVHVTPILEEPGYKEPSGLEAWPASGAWQRRNKDGTTTTIPPKVFGLLGAKLWRTTGIADRRCTLAGITYDVGDRVPEVRAWLPVRQPNGWVDAHVAALLSARYPGAKKYLNSSGQWPRRYIAMYSAALELGRLVGADTICVVEGPADAMRLMALGIPAVPLLGVGNWTDLKSTILAASWRAAVVCLDADEAGRRAQETLVRKLDEHLSVVDLVLPDGQDPASMEQIALLASLGAHGVRPRQWSL